jgi:hypothetical protein
MTWVYVACFILLSVLIAIAIGLVKKHSEKYFVIDFLIGSTILILINLIYLITNT